MKNRTAENGSKKKKKVQEKLTFTSFTYDMLIANTCAIILNSKLNLNLL